MSDGVEEAKSEGEVSMPEEHEGTYEDYVDSEFAALQQTMSQNKRAARERGRPSIQQLLPFTFSPNIRPLTESDVDSCVALENAAVPNPVHRSTLEKFQYRLAVCPEVSAGIFCTVIPGKAENWEIETLSTAKVVETGRADGAVSVLLAHVVSTICQGDVITDADMECPKDWRKLGDRPLEIGHQQHGRTVAVHSLAVAPKLHGCGLGKMIVKAFLQQVNNAGIADRVALLCQDDLVRYFERFGFQHLGPSQAKFGGGGWHDMVFDFARSPIKPR